MSLMIRLPNVNATTDKEKLAQLQSYMYQLVEQLNIALQSTERFDVSTSLDTVKNREKVDSSGETSPKATFNSIKSLIIKSADIVNSYYDVINSRLEGIYVAESEFGVFAEKTSQSITETSKSIEQVFSDMQQILTDIENLETGLINVNAYIRSGLLYYTDDGSPVYGLEVGQRTEIDGIEVFNKYARFVSNKLSFYDQNDVEVAYISDQKLYITHAEVTKTYTQGGFVDITQPDMSIVTRWIGG